MDVTSILPTPSNSGSGSAAQVRVSDVPAQRKSQVQQEPVKVAAVDKTDLHATDDNRQNLVKEAATTYFRDSFVVSDTTFSIFKDTSGKYITRFTNLRDGKVTYVPEPDILRYMESKSNARKALLEINV